MEQAYPERFKDLLAGAQAHVLERSALYEQMARPAAQEGDAVMMDLSTTYLGFRLPHPLVPGASPPPGSVAVIDRFIDALWLEDGLAANSLSAYRRDLRHLSGWLAPDDLLDACEAQLQRYFAATYSSSRATTANRRLSSMRRLYRWALREGLVKARLLSS